MTRLSSSHARKLRLVLVCALVIAGASILAGAASGSSVSTKLSAHLTRTSFTASQAGSVKLVCMFWKTNTSYAYKLSVKKGSKWQTVQSVKVKKTFKGRLSMTVKQLFAGKPIRLGSYQVTISGNYDVKTRGFKIIKAAPAAVAPTNSVSPTISGTAKQGQTLSATTGTWAGNPAPTFAYQWRRCDSSGGSCSDISGAGSATYLLVLADVGSTIRVVVTATNSAGSATATSTQTGAIAGLPPVNSALPEISGTLRQGQTLSATTGTWAGNPAPTFAYQWRRCDLSGDGCTDIAGAVNGTYKLVYADAGGTIRVAVTASNSYGSNSAGSSATSEVTGLPPSWSALPTIAGSALQGQTLSVDSPGVWTNSPSYEYQWQQCDALGNNCSDISGETSDSHTLGSGDAGKTIRVSVTASNPWGGETADSLQTMSVASNPGISAGGRQNCVVLSDGTVKCWGGNGSGQLGDGTQTSPRKTPVLVVGSDGTGTLLGVAQVSAGDNHTCALLTNGTIWCWGDNNYGQLGTGSTSSTPSTVPVQVTGIDNATEVSAGAEFTCARLDDGTIKCWGDDYNGQLGIGYITTPVPTPGLVSGISDAIEVQAGGEPEAEDSFAHACARLSDGTVKCWGRNYYGQLGVGWFPPAPFVEYAGTPRQVIAVGGDASSKLENVTQIDVGDDHSCGLLFNQTLACWGYNAGFGQVGSNTGLNALRPALVVGEGGTGTLSNVLQVSAGDNHTCAHVAGTNDSIWCWGWNLYGQLGEGGYSSDYTTPVEVLQVGGGGGLGFLTDTIQVSAGQIHTCARLSTGGAVCWGRNNAGQLGNNSTTDSNMPVTVSSLP
ncbi:MAG: hypothetical protein ABSB96_05680 [Gaiellaceae bacterium]